MILDIFFMKSLLFIHIIVVLMFTATQIYISTGTGISKESPMNAFDSALLDAGVGDLNLIKVSSVLPPGIKEVDKIPHKVGVFRPCVLSVSQGEGVPLTAGLAYGYRDDASGGYVAELSTKGNRIERFETILKDRLTAMGRDRGTVLTDIKTVHTSIDVKPGYHGCALAILVYIP